MLDFPSIIAVVATDDQHPMLARWIDDLAKDSVGHVLNNVVPITGRAGANPALEPQEAYPPARSGALAGYAALSPARE